MKRLICVVLVLCAVLCLPGCAQESNMAAPVRFYYLRATLPNDEVFHGASDSVILAEIRDGEGHLSDDWYLINQYLNGPVDFQYASPFPAGTALVDLIPEESAIHVVLSDDFAELKGMKLTLACSCLTMTVLELTGAEAVVIYTESEQLDGKDQITMDRESLILFDDTQLETNESGG